MTEFLLVGQWAVPVAQSWENEEEDKVHVSIHFLPPQDKEEMKETALSPTSDSFLRNLTVKLD